MSRNRNRHRRSSEHEIEEDLILTRSPVASLILEISKLMKKPTIDDELGSILERFLERLRESDRYLENGIFNVNFAEASLLLQSSCVLYGKKVDLLWNDVMGDLQRWCSYNRSSDDPSAIAEEEKLLERMNRFRRRKIALPQKTVTRNAIKQLDHLVRKAAEVPSLPHIVGNACQTLENLWSEAAKSSLKLKRLRAKVAPLVYTYIRKAEIYSRSTGEKLCNNDELYLNLYNAGQLPGDDRSMQLYNLRHLIDDILQSYLAQREITYTKMSECNLWPDFKKYLEANIVPRMKAIMKIQRERWNGGYGKRPLVIQKPLIDLSMLPMFGNYEVNYNPDEDTEDDDDDDETVILDLDADSPPTSPTKSSTSRRASGMCSETDSAFHDDIFVDDDEDGEQVQTRSEEPSQQETETNENSEIQETVGELNKERAKSTTNSDDSGYFEGNTSCISLDRVNSTESCAELEKENSVVKEGNVEDGQENMEASLELIERNQPDTVNKAPEVTDTQKESNVNDGLTICGNDREDLGETGIENVSKETEQNDVLEESVNALTVEEQIDAIQGYGLYEDPEDPFNQEVEDEEILLQKNEANPSTAATSKIVAQSPKKQKKDPSMESMERSRSIIKLKETKKRKQKDVQNEVQEFKSKKPKGEKTKKFVAKIIATSLVLQEKFFIQHYIPDENEGGIPPEEFEDEEINEEDNNNNNGDSCSFQREIVQSPALSVILSDHCYAKPLTPIPSENLDVEPPIGEDTLNAPEPESPPPSPPNPLLDEVTSPSQEDVSTSEELDKQDNTATGQDENPSSEVDKSNEDSELSSSGVRKNRKEKKIDEDLFLVEGEDTVDKIEHFHNEIRQNKYNIEEFTKRRAALLEWKAFIQPKIDAEDTVFDIHEYGSHIMDAIPIGGSKKFDTLVENRPAAEVTRFFLAALQLANTNNIELNNIPEGELANDEVEIKLLTRERYHEQLQEFVAPSEESFREKLKKVKEQEELYTLAIPSTSTGGSTTPSKRARYN